MAHHNSRSHGRESGSARHRHTRHPNSVSYSTSEFSADRQVTANFSNTPSRRGGRANDALYDYTHDDDVSDSGSDIHEHSGNQNLYDERLQEPYHYRNVQRAWQSEHPGLDRVVNNVAIHEAIRRLEGRSHMHSNSFRRPPRPISNEIYCHEAYSPEFYERDSRPLGRSNLRELDRNRESTNATRRWVDEDRRAGPYDNVGQVRQSNYERRLSRRREQDEQSRQNLAYGYDSRSDTIC